MKQMCHCCNHNHSEEKEKTLLYFDQLPEDLKLSPELLATPMKTLTREQVMSVALFWRFKKSDITLGDALVTLYTSISENSSHYTVERFIDWHV